MSYQEQTTKDQTVADDRDERLATHDLLDTAATDGEFTRFLAALSATGLNSLLKGPDLLTLFVPVNAAFDALGENTQQTVDTSRIAGMVRYHIVPGAITIADAGSNELLNTMEGVPLRVSHENGNVLVGGGRILRGDIECTNGVIHAIDRVLFPR